MKTLKLQHEDVPGGSGWGVSTFRWVCEREACFGISQLVEVMEAHHVRSLKMALGVLVPLPTPPDFIVKLGRRNGSQVGRVGARDADSII